jgi:DNA adenine methylase
MMRFYSNITGVTINRKPSSLEEGMLSKESYYYWMRSEYNRLSADEKKSIVGSSLFIFLNKTCFRGIFRVGPNGFNVPYGWNKNPDIIDVAHLREISVLIENVNFESCSFEKSMNNITEGDFTYLDPPYAPENATSFVSYTVEGFGVEKHNELFSMCRKLDEKKFNS